MPPRSSSQEAQSEEYSSDFLMAMNYRASGENAGVWLLMGGHPFEPDVRCFYLEAKVGSNQVSVIHSRVVPPFSGTFRDRSV